MQALRHQARATVIKLICAGILLPFDAAAAPVVGISDGDTLTVLEDRRSVKIRLANIDAPEKAQPFGQRSKESLSELCYGKNASYQVQDIDRYGRTVAIVTCAGVQANRAQVERGLAWVYPKYNRDESLPPLQEDARTSRRGLFADPDPVAPWEWRKK
ncbi:MAG TPA: thermonuclease family protein [Noviherbaspirillum sp.]|nr:thermonuclease family protein [Noviherbaspirillum sp.]